MVDQSDLLALMDDEQVEEYMNKTGVGEKEGQPVTEEEEVEEEKTEEPVVEEKPVKKNEYLYSICGIYSTRYYIDKIKIVPKT